MTGVALVEAVRASRVEDGDPCVDGGRDRRERALLVPVGVGGEAHAAEADAQLRGSSQSVPPHPASLVQVVAACRRYPGGV